MSTLNLLNPIEIKKVSKIKLYFLVKHFLIQFISILLIISTILIFSATIIDSNLSSLDQQIEKELLIRQDGNVNSIEESTKLLNNQLQQVDKIQNNYIKWTDFLTSFLQEFPEGIKVNDLKFSTNIIVNSSLMTFEISGIATVRDDLISFQEILKDSANFTNIKTPITNLIQKENINFTITGNLTNEIYN